MAILLRVLVLPCYKISILGNEHKDFGNGEHERKDVVSACSIALVNLLEILCPSKNFFVILAVF